MSLRKPLAASAAITVALALAASPAGASAATTAPTSRTASVGAGGNLLGAGGSFLGVAGPLQPGSPGCLFLVRQLQFALLTHNTAYANFVSLVLLYSGCGGAAT